MTNESAAAGHVTAISSLIGRLGCEASVPGTPYLVRQEASSCSCQELQIKDRRRIRRKHLQLLANNNANM